MTDAEAQWAGEWREFYILREYNLYSTKETAFRLFWAIIWII